LRPFFSTVAMVWAVMAARRDQGDETWFAMPAPATVGRVLA